MISIPYGSGNPPGSHPESPVFYVPAYEMDTHPSPHILSAVLKVPAVFFSVIQNFYSPVSHLPANELGVVRQIRIRIRYKIFFFLLRERSFSICDCPTSNNALQSSLFTQSNICLYSIRNVNATNAGLLYNLRFYLRKHIPNFRNFTPAA